MSSYQELLAQKAALEKQQADLEKALAEARQSARSGVIAQIRKLMSEHGLTLADLGGGKTGSRGARKSNGRSGVKVAPKYRNPATGETWTGRGLKPRWFQAALTSGKVPADFAI